MSGYDLSVIDQAIWKYSKFKIPITTTHVYYDTPIYYDHLEIIYLLFAPLYWLFDSVITLIVLQVIAIISSGISVFLIAKHYSLKNIVANSILISYLSFFGIQFAIWSDVHSLVFGVVFLAWFLYFLETGKTRLTLLFLILALFSKEDMGLLSAFISGVYFIFHKNKISFISFVISSLYLLFIFYVYFPHITPSGYRFANPHGILSDVNPYYFINTPDKQKAIFYSLGWFGFIPFFAPFYLLPFLGDLGHYFVLGNAVVSSAQGLFEHYRSSVALLLVWPTIIAIAKFKRLNTSWIAVYILICVIFFQYYLHLPISYLTKKWFWETPKEVFAINQVLRRLPSNASVATQNNIAVHIAHRDNIYTLFPGLRDFPQNSPCGTKTCRWFRVGGNPDLLLIDTGSSWNILHYLGTREDFMDGISNLEKNGNIKIYYRQNTTRLYKVVKKI